MADDGVRVRVVIVALRKSVESGEVTFPVKRFPVAEVALLAFTRQRLGRSVWPAAFPAEAGYGFSLYSSIGGCPFLKLRDCYFHFQGFVVSCFFFFRVGVV